MSEFFKPFFEELQFTPATDETAVELLKEQEEDFEFEYPAAILEWYSREGAVEFLIRGYSSQVAVALVNLVPEPVISQAGSSETILLSELPAGAEYQLHDESFLPLVQESKSGNCWWAKCNGEDNPGIWYGSPARSVESFSELEQPFTDWVRDRFGEESSAHAAWIIERFPDEPFAYRVKAKLEADNYDTDAAISSLTRVIEMEPENAANYVERGHVYLNDEDDYEYLDEPELAKQDFQRALERGSTDPKIYNGLALIALSERDAEAARENLQRAIDAGTENARMYYFLGEVLRKAGEFQAAADRFTRAIELDEYEEDFTIGRARCLFELGRYAEALRDCERAAEQAYYCEAVHWLRGKIQMQEGNLEEAQGNFDRAIDWDAEPEYFIDRARCFLAQGKPEEARRDCRSVDFTEENDEPGLRLEFVDVLIELGDYEKAREELDPLLNDSDWAHKARIYRGLSYFAEEQFENALEENEQALQLKPDDETAQLNAGICCERLGEFDKARELLNGVIARNPEIDLAYYNRGRVRMALGDSGGAKVDFQQTAELSPTEADPYIELAKLSLQSGEAAEARDFAELAQQCDAENAEAVYCLGRANCQLGNYAEGLSLLEFAVRLDSKNVGLLSALAWLLATCPEGEIRDGLEALDSAELACDLSLHEDCQALASLAAAHAELGEFDEATEVLVTAREFATTPVDRELLDRLRAACDKERKYRAEPAEF